MVPCGKFSERWIAQASGPLILLVYLLVLGGAYIFLIGLGDLLSSSTLLCGYFILIQIIFNHFFAWTSNPGYSKDVRCDVDSSMNDSRKLSYSEDLRQRGNEFYREKSFESALLCYKNALYWASIASDDNRMMRFEIQGQIFANISALHFQRKSYELAVHCCGRVLDDKKFQKKIKNLNALLIRRADANSQLNEFDLVKNDLTRLT